MNLVICTMVEENLTTGLPAAKFILLTITGRDVAYEGWADPAEKKSSTWAGQRLIGAKMFDKCTKPRKSGLCLPRIGYVTA